MPLPSTLSSAVSLVRMSPRLEGVLACLRAPVQGFGSSMRDSFAFFDRDSSSWRTSQDSLLPDSESSWPTWPKQGMTRVGLAYELPTSEHHTAANGSSSLLPTPNASVSQDGEKPETFFARAEALKVKHGNGNGVGTPLTIAVQLLPTPSASGDARNTHPSGDYFTLAGELSLLPTPKASNNENRSSEGYRPGVGRALREIQSGESTLLPSDAGRPSKGDPHPGQLTISDA